MAISMQVIVQEWGNSLGLRIPLFWAKDNDIKNGSTVEVIMEKLIILPPKKSLDDMLALVNEENIHSEVSTGYAVGKEAW